MKKILKISLALFCVFIIVFACAQTDNENSLQMSSDTNLKSMPQFGFIAEDGNFVEVTKEDIVKLWIDQFKLDDNSTFDVEIVENINPSTNEKYYSLYCTGLNNANTISTGLTKQSNSFFSLKKQSCKCDGEKCGNGCKVQTSDNGETCTCSGCGFGTCTKTSTTVSNYSLALVEAGVY